MATPLLLASGKLPGRVLLAIAQFYFWGRVAYAMLYAAGLPLARSLVWNIPTIGTLMIVAALFLK